MVIITELLKLAPYVTEIVKAASGAIHLPMLAVDIFGEQVVFTGDPQYRKSCDSLRLLVKSVFMNEQPMVLQNLNCADCPHNKTCGGLSAIAYPIVRITTYVGILLVLSYDKAEREIIDKETSIYTNFLKFQSQMIENKISLAISNDMLEKRNVDVGNSSRETVHFIGTSPQVMDMLYRAKKASATDSTVLIRGESGTGKEVVAKIIHNNSTRTGRPMISINCAAIPEHLVESELFGYDDGAFTGAKKNGYMGKFERANNSTLFLDEIGDMPLSVQTKLLRVLQEQKVERIGGKKPIPINVRVICATNRNLEEMIEKGLFRSDLYYRINIVPIEIAPLRLRKEDIRVLTDFFVDYYNKKMNKNIIRLDAEVWKTFYNYTWPGNVRELKNIIEYLENIAECDTISMHDLPDQMFLKQKNYIADKSLSEIINSYEYRILSFMVREAKTLEEKVLLADHLKISRATLYRKMKHHKLI